MKTRAPAASRAVVLTAAVWLLVQPPVVGGTLDPSAPIGSWTAAGRFATREACELQRSKDADAILAAVGTRQDSGSNQARQLVSSRRCLDASTLAPQAAPAS